VSIAESEANSQFFASFLDDYFAECDEHLTNVRRELLVLESFVGQPKVNPATLEELFRSFHSLKGISGMVGQGEAERLAHQMESYLRALRQSQATLSTEGIDGLIAGTRMLEQVTSAYRAGRAMPNIAPTLAQLAGLAAECPDDLPQKPRVALPSARLNGLENGQRPQVKDGLRTWHITFTPAAELAERGINVNHIRARLQEIGELIQASPKVMPQGGITFEFTVATTADEATFAAWSEDGVSYAPLPTEPSEVKSAPVSSDNLMIAPSHVVRVDLSRLDELMRLVGERVISRGHLEDRLKDLETNLPATEWRGLQEINSTLERQLRDLREGVMRMRLVPIREIFERMPFVVRNLARESDKKIKLELRGQPRYRNGGGTHRAGEITRRQDPVARLDRRRNALH
jgi:two-component system chemotaxis sensor kinase CheA